MTLYKLFLDLEIDERVCEIPKKNESVKCKIPIAYLFYVNFVNWNIENSYKKGRYILNKKESISIETFYAFLLINVSKDFYMFP